MIYKKIQTFLNKKTSLPKLIVVYGPTACGKTSLSLDIAEKFNGEIIGADSRQIYKYLDIGTGKIEEDEKKGIKHYMIDFLDLDQDYSVGEYKKTVIPLVKEIFEKGKIPILCGGTGLYIDSIIYNFQIPEIEPDWDLRQKLEKIRLTKGNDFLWQMLNKIDPEYANTIHPNNYRYVQRGLEIKEKTGKSKNDLKIKKEKIFDYLLISPDFSDRKALYNKINMRIDEMFEKGLIEEVKNILTFGYEKKCSGLNTIGYKEIISYLDGNIGLEETKELIKKHNRNYAKRQITRFKRYDNPV
ncbi:MAG: tRNA (adenosine(37)-N6)-dimethylallyltransferase MiaA [Candidatus Gracilibacteria bacterium]|nr:tRNA (adenosine(37)-N6)-dimethylallyltransferase MiaA [Candidatus Gracilibacteria bacterium]